MRDPSLRSAYHPFHHPSLFPLVILAIIASLKMIADSTLPTNFVDATTTTTTTNVLSIVDIELATISREHGKYDEAVMYEAHDDLDQQSTHGLLSSPISPHVAVLTETPASTATTFALGTTLLAWLSIALSIISGASVGPAFKFLTQHGIPPCLSASWRCQCMTLILLPLAVLEVYMNPNKNSVDWFGYKPDLTFPVFVHVAFSGMAWAGNVLFWLVALQYTSIFKAAVITCSHPLIFVFYLRYQGVKVSKWEFVGVCIAFVGLIISSWEDLLESQRMDGTDVGTAADGSSAYDRAAAPHPDAWHQILGIVLCLLSAGSEVAIMSNRITTKKYVPLMQYTTATTFVIALCATFTSLALEGAPSNVIPIPPNQYAHAESVPVDATSGTEMFPHYQGGIEIFCLVDNCIFGWLSSRWFTFILLFSIWIGVICMAGFNYAVRDF